MTTVHKTKKHSARGVSLPPGMEALALKRARALDMSFSRYVQRLVELDIREKLLSPLSKPDGIKDSAALFHARAVADLYDGRPK